MKSVTERRLLVLEAMVLLLVARIALKLLPFSWLRWCLARPMTRPEVRGDRRERLKNRVYGAVWEAHQRLPLETACFPRAIAAQNMLRRRGVAIRLVYGATRKQDQGLVGHVWPVDGNEETVDIRFTQGYDPLVQFPEG